MRQPSAPVGLLGAPLAAGSVTPGRATSPPPCCARRCGGSGVTTSKPAASFDAQLLDRGDVELDGLSIEEATPPIRDAVAESAKPMG